MNPERPAPVTSAPPSTSIPSGTVITPVTAIPTAKLRLDFVNGILEAEGSEEFLRAIYDDFKIITDAAYCIYPYMIAVLCVPGGTRIIITGQVSAESGRIGNNVPCIGIGRAQAGESAPHCDTVQDLEGS